MENHVKYGENIYYHDKDGSLYDNADKDGYLVITRKWNNNDKLELVTPSHFYNESVPENKDRPAVFYGPLLLAGVLSDKEPEPQDIPVLVTTNRDVNTWMKASDASSLSFETTKPGVPKDVKMIPFNSTKDEHYFVYWDVFSPDEWAVQQKKYEEVKRKQKELDDRTVDLLRVGKCTSAAAEPRTKRAGIARRSFSGGWWLYFGLRKLLVCGYQRTTTPCLRHFPSFAG